MDQHAVASDLAEAMQAGCLGMRVTRLHRVVSRTYEQELQQLGLSQPQVEILAELMCAPGPVKPTALAARLLIERSTLSRNMALMQEKGWLVAVETSPAGRTMSVAIADSGVAVLARARTAWQQAQSRLETTLGPAASSTLDGWLEFLTKASAEVPTSS
jgi:DNA-binding MarR family transcriptional regulator